MERVKGIEPSTSIAYIRCILQLNNLRIVFFRQFTPFVAILTLLCVTICYYFYRSAPLFRSP